MILSLPSQLTLLKIYGNKVFLSFLTLRAYKNTEDKLYRMILILNLLYRKFVKEEFYILNF